MEDLTSLMQVIDLNSKIISEGDYLKMCNSIKKIHDHIKYIDCDSDESDDEEFIIRRVIDNITVPVPPFSTTPRTPQLPPLGNESPDTVIDDLVRYDTVPPSPIQSRRGDFVHMELPPIRTQIPDILRDRELEDELLEVNRSIHVTLKRMEKLKHRRNITSFVREEAVKRCARGLGIRLRVYTISALLDAGHDVGSPYMFFKEYLDDYNDDIDAKHRELSEELKELEYDKTSIIDELINF